MGDAMSPRRPAARQRGVTIIEIAVVLTISALLYMAGAPLFSVWLANTHTRTAAESFLNGVQLARAEAIRRNRMVQINFDPAATASSWTVGCAIPVDAGDAGVDDPGDCLAVIHARTAAETSDNPTFAPTPGDATTITFDSLGRVVQNLDGSPTATSIDVTNPVIAAASRRTLRLAFGPAGDVRMCDPAVASSDPRGC
jgi:type IV fimbrial biogenesis protein FimT